MAGKIKVLNIGVFNRSEDEWFYRDLISFHNFFAQYSTMFDIESIYFERHSNRKEEVMRSLSDFVYGQTESFYILCVHGHGAKYKEDWTLQVDIEASMYETDKFISGKEFEDSLNSVMKNSIVGLIINSCSAIQGKLKANINANKVVSEKIKSNTSFDKTQIIDETYIVERIGAYIHNCKPIYHELEIISNSKALTHLETNTQLREISIFEGDVKITKVESAKLFFIYSLSRKTVQPHASGANSFGGTFMNILRIGYSTLRLKEVYELAKSYFCFSNETLFPQLSIHTYNLEAALHKYLNEELKLYNVDERKKSQIDCFFSLIIGRDFKNK